MATVDTVLSPREVLNRLYERLRNAYSRVLSAAPGDVGADEKIMVEIEAMELLIQKLNYSFIKKVRNDASIDADSHEKLKEIEKLLEEIASGKKVTLRQDHFLYRTAKHMRNVVRGKANKTKKVGTKEFVNVQKEKKQLVRKEVDAREKMGKK